jgi:ABC-type lipoprotein export system ATPase subunit
VVIVTHEPEAAAIADRVFRLQEGRLVAAAATIGSQARPHGSPRAIRRAGR